MLSCIKRPKMNTASGLLGHFLGNHSVLDILRQEGYQVEHTAPGQPITEYPANSEEVTAGPGVEGDTGATDDPPGWESGSPGPGEGRDGLPQLLLPDSLSQLEEFGRQKRPRKQQRAHSRPRLFSDLWVRMEASTTPLANIRITNGYVTVEPPLTQQEQRRRTVGTPWEHPDGSATPLAPLNLASRDTGHALTCLITCLVLHMSFTS